MVIPQSCISNSYGSLIIERTKSVIYEINEVNKNGGFGVVYIGTRCSDNLPIAIKVINKTKVPKWTQTDNGHTIPLEIEIMLKVKNCKKSIQIIDYAEQKDYFMIVMERPLNCVDFWDYINDNGPLNEITAKKYFKQIVEGVIELKSNGVLHRDIKDENILVDLINDEIKIIDFGASTHYTNQDLYDFHGTMVYAPPEWIRSNRYNGDRATVWSLGILLYNMIYGDVPFQTNSQILHSKLSLSQNISESVNQLISDCLNVVEEKRISLEQVNNHEWLTDLHLQDNNFENLLECENISCDISLDRDRIILQNSSISSSTINKTVSVEIEKNYKKIHESVNNIKQKLLNVYSHAKRFTIFIIRILSSVFR